MTNDLKNFLEQYHDNKIFSDDQLGEIQYVIIPKVLDLVEKEVGNYIQQNRQKVERLDRHVLDELPTIINNLRV